jgi:hypothetical protein
VHVTTLGIACFRLHGAHYFASPLLPNTGMSRGLSAAKTIGLNAFVGQRFQVHICSIVV